MSDPHSSQNLFELSPSGLFSGPRESTAQLIPKNAIADLTWLLQSYSRHVSMIRNNQNLYDLYLLQCKFIS